MRTTAKLLDICDFQGGTQPPKDEWISEPRDGYIRMLQIRDYTQGDEKFIEYVLDNGKLHKCNKDDIMLSRYGYIGQAFTGLAGAYNVALVKVIRKKEIEAKYLLYYFKSRYFQNHLLENVGARATIPGFNKTELKNAIISIPDEKDQKHIANILERVEHVISLRQEQLSILDDLIKARFVEMFGDPDANPMRWTERLLSEMLNILGGYAFKSEGFSEVDGIPVLRIGNINAGFFKPVNMVFWEEDESLERYIMYPGDLVMSLTGTVGKDDYGNVCILGNDYDKYYLNQRNAKLELKEGLDKHYLSQLLRFEKIKKRLTGISRGVRQANISNKDILNLSVPIPPADLQLQYAAFVAQVDKSKAVIQKAIDETQLLYDSLMQEFFA